MTTSKLVDSNRRTHAAKVLAKASTKNQHHEENENENTEAELNTASMESVENSEASASNDIFGSLNEQYSVIREDILKLREDLAHGYDLIKEIIDSRLSIKSLLKLSK